MGPSVSCSWWNGTPNALTVPWSISCAEHLPSYSPIDTLEYAKYACACDESGACGGVYYHSGQPWTDAAIGKYYLCKREPLTCEDLAGVQVVYGMGPSVSCSWWNGTPNA